MEQATPVQNQTEPQENSQKSSGQAAVVGIILAVVILLALVFVYKAYKRSQSTTQTPSAYSTPVSQVAGQPSPAPTPLTAQNTPTVVDQTGAAIEQDLNQMNTDMQNLNQNDTTQDNANSI